MTPGADPLFDTLFRPTVAPPSITSAAPVRAEGTRARAGNAMGRTRAALLTGAHRAVEASGTRFTMSQVATAAGVAKATLYNHFRTREAVLAALLDHEVELLLERAEGRGLAEALADAARTLSEHRLLRVLSRTEPGTLAALARVDLSTRGWLRARDGVAALLLANGHAGTDTVLRWLASFVLTPAGPTAIAADLEVLLAGLPLAPLDTRVAAQTA